MKFTLTAVLLTASLIFAPLCSWAMVFEVRTATELHDALDEAGENGEFDTIRIYQGIYLDNFTYTERDSEEDKMTTLWGGYSDEEDPSDDPSKTILDGDNKGRVLKCSICGSLTIRNLTIQNGNGGLFVHHAPREKPEKPGTVCIYNNIFQNNLNENYGGGGLSINCIYPEGKAANIWLIGNIISGNKALNYRGGGGASLYVNAGLISKRWGHICALGNTVTENETRGEGGGLRIWSRSNTGPAGRVVLADNTITNNRAEGGDYGLDGGGVYILSESRAEGVQEEHPKSLNMITVRDNIIQRNYAEKEGGGVCIQSTSRTGTAASITVKKNIISQNIAGQWSGGAYIGSSVTHLGRSGDVVLKQNLISDNSAEAQAGGAIVSSQTGEVIMTNNMIVDNTSNHSGGLLVSGNVTATNNTIANNEAVDRVGGVTFSGDIVNVYNNIIWGNSAPTGEVGDILLWCGTFAGYHNDYEDIEGAWSVSGGNIHQDPRFIGSGNYHLRFSSPCRDAGTAGAPYLPADDYDGWNRIFGSAPDMGADEIHFLNLKRLALKWQLKFQRLLGKVVKD